MMNQPKNFQSAESNQSPIAQNLSEAGMVLQLADGTIQACNSAAEEILGFTLDQIQGHDSNDCIWQTIHEDGSPFPGETHPVTIALSTGRAVYGTVMGLYQPNGNLVWLRIDANPLFQAGEATPWAAVATFRDITAQHSASVVTNDSQSQPPTPASSVAQYTLLIIEDSPGDRELYRRYLTQDTSSQYRILEAATGAEALEICQNISVDAVLLDYFLPDYDGLELLQILISQRPNRPVLLLTGYGSESLAVQVLKSGAEDYLIKDVLAAPDLQVAVRSAIQKTELRAQLRQAQERERLVAQIAQQIRQSLDLSTILETTVTEIRQLFQTDRITLFRFNRDGSVLAVAESVAEGWRSVLFESIQDACLSDTFIRRYQQGRVFAVPDIYNADLNPCHVEMLAQFQVRAVLVIPVFKGDQLWGLLIAHHCAAPRLWESFEIELLQQLSTHLGTAIQQSELYRQAQSELSERRRIEAELRESELFNLKILESTSDCIKVLNLEGHILYMNPGGQEQLGIDDFARYRGCPWTDFWNEETQPTVAEAVATAKSGRSSKFEGFCPALDGTPKWWDVGVSPVLDAEGEVERLLAVSHDITSRKNSEIASQESNARLRLLYDTVKALLISAQPLTLVDTIFHGLRESLALELYLNYIVEDSANSERGEDRLRLASFGGIDPELVQEIESLTFEQALYGTTAQVRDQFVRSDAESANNPKAALVRNMGMTAYSSQPLICQGQLLGTLSFGSSSRAEFTEAETELLRALCDQIAIALERANLISSLQTQADQLHYADRLKDEFLAVLSHELRNPLNPILGWAQLLRYGDLDPNTTQIAVDTIERNARLQSQLIEDLLDISRIMRGKMTLNAEPIRLATVIEAALETVQLAAEVKQIQIEVTLEEVAAVSGDAGRLQQVVWNLLSNAVKFTNPNGQIEIQLTQTESSVKVEVTDNGKGISPDFVPYVFEYFRQQDGSTTRSFGGLGLGLAIARQIVEMHGGIIWAESEGEAQGARFAFQLPALDTVEIDQPEKEVSSVPERSLAGLRFLAVDDDADTRDLLLYLLENHGAQVTLAGSAAEALEILEELTPDVVLSDIGMPEIDGYGLVRTIRASEQNRNLPVIAITAYAGELNQQQALSAGFNRHIAKPINIKQLIGAILETVRPSELE